ncbi:transcriptional regulator [Pseudalkalibacillus decolorationis]|uniref:transcriptional regulator n=1 Tax=Pseudalkalibacillus decolorationis TaxID=163879 RepID=UPI002149907D|nr:transcriptional regulator [Pseudalkalibacillus decolorationis]
MTTKIAVIGSADFINNIFSIAPRIEDIEIEPYVYQQPQEAAELIRLLKPCDAVFYSGVLPFYFSKEMQEQLPIPVLFLEQDEMAISSSLLSINYHQNIAIERISIDLIDSSFVENVLTDIGIDRAPRHVMDYADMLPNKFDATEIIDFHHSRFKSGETDFALTSVHAVYDELQQLGVPSQRMLDPTKALIRGLQDAKAQAESAKNHSATVAVSYISLPVPHGVQNNYLDVFANYIHASVQQIDDSSFKLYSTRGDIESLMKNGAFHELLLNWQEPVTVGFGYGATTAEAEQNAKIARSFATKHENESCGYILTEEKELLGPYPKENKTQRLRNDHPELLQIAKETKLSPANLSKIIQFSKSRQSLQFTAADLSNYLQVTRRSTERILKKLVDHGSVKIVGEEMTYQQGRPRAIYELNIPIYR